jgi:hypothetical protein
MLKRFTLPGSISCNDEGRLSPALVSPRGTTRLVVVLVVLVIVVVFAGGQAHQ